MTSIGVMPIGCSNMEYDIKAKFKGPAEPKCL